jgi:hypothetical protein
MVTVADGRRQGAGRDGMDDWEWRTEAREGIESEEINGDGGGWEKAGGW